VVASDGGLTDVLVVGAGPTGLATALQVCAHGGGVRIVERRHQAPRPSRAMILHPRTLEVLRPLGVTDALLERADTRPRAQLHVGHRVLDVQLGEFALPDSAFPHLTLIRQMDVEAVLADALEARGVVVERGTELTGLRGMPAGIVPLSRRLPGVGAVDGAGNGSVAGQRAGDGSVAGQRAGNGSMAGGRAGNGSMPGRRPGDGSVAGQASVIGPPPTWNVGVDAVLRAEGGTFALRSRYIVGCDGPASSTRRLLGIGWRGAAYHQEVVLADVDLEPWDDAELAPGVLHAVAGRGGLVFLFALGEGAPWRLLATRAAGPGGSAFGQPGESVARLELQEILDTAGLPARIGRLAWSARVPLQHRMADSFREGRLFLAGDAAHAHSPAGGQGMNTGIQDALNLGWKLAFAAQAETRSTSAVADSWTVEPSDRLGARLLGAAARSAGSLAPLLQSYEEERRCVARRVLALTHLIFFAEASTTPLARWVRTELAPVLAPALPVVLRRRRLVAEGVRTLSQLRTRYHGSPISVDLGAAGALDLRPGGRVGDEWVTCDGRRQRLQELVGRPGIHLLSCRDAAPLDQQALGPQVTVHRLSDRAGAGVVAVRPDGYVGFRSAKADAGEVTTWLELVAAR
jgi:2-polyprenyl-6-methoxyphenol hydroxylase-like FAD-dependent oxidoreductase